MYPRLDAAPVNRWLVASAVLVAGLGLFHSILGERYIVRRLLRRENLPRLFGDDSFTKRTIRYAWHATTLLILGTAGALVYLASRPTLDPTGTGVVRVFAIAFGACGLWGMVSTRLRHWSWLVFLAAAALAWAATL